MTQAYFDPKRASDPHALPDCETFYMDGNPSDGDPDPREAGWYWQACLPGCLPDGDPVGPFATKAEALADAQDCNDDAEAGTLADDAAEPSIGEGYGPCGCRDCMETAIGKPGTFCQDCRTAGCEPNKECCAPGAYGTEVE